MGQLLGPAQEHWGVEILEMLSWNKAESWRSIKDK